jgi:hypothetical protein
MDWDLSHLILDMPGKSMHPSPNAIGVIVSSANTRHRLHDMNGDGKAGEFSCDCVHLYPLDVANISLKTTFG